MAGAYLAATYEPTQVGISIAVAVYASFIALDLIKHVRAAAGTGAWKWLACGSLALGTGIWTMHFIGMLAFRLPLALGYRELQTVLSWLAAVAVSFIALWVTTREMSGLRLALGAAAMGAGICVMHYTGMAAIDLAPAIVWNAWLVTASAAIAVAASTAALMIFFWLPLRTGRGSFALQVAAAITMGLAISGMHYTGMAAASFPAGAVCYSADAISGERLGLPITALCAVLLIGFDAYLHARNERTERLAASLQQANRDLAQARDAAEAANRSKSEFLANMSHEVRTPMNAIIGLTDIVLGSELDKQQRDFLEKVHGSSTALLGILNDILDYSKIEAGHLHIERVPFALEAPLSSVANLFGPLVEQKGLELFFEIAPDVPTQMLGDPLRVTQVLNNLVGNAVKFTASGSVHVKVDVAAHRSDGHVLRIAVHDTGIGVSDEQAAHLFEAFAQADNSVTRRYGGTGLGLSISRRLVQLMGGTIAVRGALGSGSCFTFTLDVGAAPGKLRRLDARHLRGLKALVVDDQDISRLILRNLCASWSMAVDTAESGSVGLALIDDARRRGEPHDVMLVDWKMPGMSGLEMVRRLRADVFDGKVPLAVMVTAYGQAQLLRDAGEMRLDAVLVKPVVASALYNVLTSLLPPLQRHDGTPAAALTPQVLLVEDNLLNQQVACAYLRAVGIEPRLAIDGAEAVAMVERMPFDLVLMDLHMPGIDGYEATRRILELGADAPPVVAMTAAVMTEDRQRCAEAGMVDFIAKPINLEEIRRVIDKWVPQWGDALATALPPVTKPPAKPPPPRRVA